MADFTPATLLGDIAARVPRAIGVLEKHRIDFCCGGDRTLEAGCAERGIDPQELLREIAALESGARGADLRWDLRPIPELIDHILLTFHRPLYSDLPRIGALARKVARVHGDRVPRLRELAEVYGALRAELSAHLVKEEEVLFPRLLASLEGSGAAAEISEVVGELRAEHDGAGEVLAGIRELSEDFSLPEEACGSWRALWTSLQDFERALHEHIHLENNVLFRRLG